MGGALVAYVLSGADTVASGAVAEVILGLGLILLAGGTVGLWLPRP